MSTRTGLDRAALRQAMILVLVGGPLVVIDLTINSFDLLNDTIGLGLILMAVNSLARQPGPPSYASRMRLLLFLTASTTLWSVVTQVVPELGFGPLGLLFAAVSTIAIILFCTSMRDLSRVHGLVGAADSWRQASVLVVIFFVVGWILGVVLYISRAADEGTLTPSPASIDISGGIGAVLLVLTLVAAVIPLLFILFAIFTLLREMRATPDALTR